MLDRGNVAVLVGFIITSILRLANTYWLFIIWLFIITLCTIDLSPFFFNNCTHSFVILLDLFVLHAFISQFQTEVMSYFWILGK